MMESEVWFFAYGWALDRNLLRKIIGEVGSQKKALLRGYRLVFDVFSPSWRGGVANIVEDKDGVVYGAVYRIKNEQFNNLDEAIGVPTLFSKRKVIVEAEDLGMIECITYISPASRGRWVKPSDQYLSVLLRGLKQLKYRDDIIEEIKKIAYGGRDIYRRT